MEMLQALLHTLICIQREPYTDTRTTYRSTPFYFFNHIQMRIAANKTLCSMMALHFCPHCRIRASYTGTHVFWIWIETREMKSTLSVHQLVCKTIQQMVKTKCKMKKGGKNPKDTRFLSNGRANRHNIMSRHVRNECVSIVETIQHQLSDTGGAHTRARRLCLSRWMINVRQRRARIQQIRRWSEHTSTCIATYLALNYLLLLM